MNHISKNVIDDYLKNAVFTGSRAYGYEDRLADYDYVVDIATYHNLRSAINRDSDYSITEGDYYQCYYFYFDHKRYNIILTDTDKHLWTWKVTTDIIKLLCEIPLLKRKLSDKNTRIKLFEGIRILLKIIFGPISFKEINEISN